MENSMQQPASFHSDALLEAPSEAIHVSSSSVINFLVV
jgi:hypothetical protein